MLAATVDLDDLPADAGAWDIERALAERWPGLDTLPIGLHDMIRAYRREVERVTGTRIDTLDAVLRLSEARDAKGGAPC